MWILQFSFSACSLFATVWWLLEPYQVRVGSTWVALKVIGPFLVIDYIAAPNIQGCQNGTLILGTTHTLAPSQGSSRTINPVRAQSHSVRMTEKYICIARLPAKRRDEGMEKKVEAGIMGYIGTTHYYMDHSFVGPGAIL